MVMLRGLMVALLCTLRKAIAFHHDGSSQISLCPTLWRRHHGAFARGERSRRNESIRWKSDNTEASTTLDRALFTRGGADERSKTFVQNSRGGVNRQAVPAAEALSRYHVEVQQSVTNAVSRRGPRYPTLKTPGGLVRFLDYVGTASFAMSGAATAGMRGMNLLGCVIVGAIAATGGGTTRDILLGQTPVFWLVEVEYVGICIGTALTTFFLWPILSRVSVLSHMGTGFDGWLSQALDTIGLASFAVVGTQHGIRRGCHPVVTVIICMITCSGGGIIRDVLTSSPVLVLSAHTQMYVSTTTIGSAAYLLARRLSEDPLTRISAGFFCVILLRMLASVYNIRLPTIVKRS